MAGVLISIKSDWLDVDLLERHSKHIFHHWPLALVAAVKRFAAWVFHFSECICMSKIYVGNLPFTADEAAVRALFAQHGAVESVALINDRDTGQPRGFGFVEMARADAARAIQNLNGFDMGGRALKVNEAQEKKPGGGGGGFGGGGGGGRRY